MTICSSHRGPYSSISSDAEAPLSSTSIFIPPLSPPATATSGDGLAGRGVLRHPPHCAILGARVSAP